MNKFLKTIAFVSLGVSMLTSVSLADSLIGARLSYGHFIADGSNKVAGGSTTSGTQTANFPYASIFVEHVIERGFSIGLDFVPFSAEIESTSKSDTDRTDAASDDVTGTKKAKANLKNHTTLYVATPKLNNFYGKVGYAAAQVEITDFSTLSTMAAISSKKDTMHGPVIGAGYQKDLGNGLVLQAEVTYTNYNEISFSGASGSTVKANPENIAAHIGIAKKF